MQQQSRKLTYKLIYILSLFVLLVSRILVLTKNYNWFINPIMLEILYLMSTVFLAVAAHGTKLVIHKGRQWCVLGVLLAHTVLWGTMRVDERYNWLIFDYFKTQIMFVVIVIVTVWAVQCLDAEEAFFKCCYYALSLVLFVQLITHFSELDLSNLANIMSATDRTRANFGFGHYNTLGGSCVCNILLYEIIKKQGRRGWRRVMDVSILLMSLVMMLCSASRSSITSLILYFIVFGLLTIDRWRVSKKLVVVLKLLAGVAILVMIGFVVFGVDISSVLVQSQRAHIFTQTLPLFFESGKVWLGLGYAANTAYGLKQMPYATQWMDNGYVYILVTTGIIGAAVFAGIIMVIGNALRKNQRTLFGKQMMAIFCVYLYISLFEATLFSAGMLVNYFYLPWLLFGMTHGKHGEDAEERPAGGGETSVLNTTQ